MTSKAPDNTIKLDKLVSVTDDTAALLAALNAGAASGVDQYHAVEDVVSCAVGDYLEVFYYHAYGSAQDITGNSLLSFFSVSQV